MTDGRRIRRLANRYEWAVFVAAGVAVVMLFTLDGADGNSSSDIDSGADTASGPEAGEAAALYGRFCSSCHGVDGGGGVGPRLENLDDRCPDRSSLPALIANGRGIMPGFVSTMSGDEIVAVADYVRSRFG